MDNKLFILLDRSGSMDSMWSEAIGGINGYINEFKLNNKNADVQLAVFDNLSYDVIRNTTVMNWEPVKKEEVQPRGGTPLLDASARIIHNLLDSGAKKAVLVIVTDGHENNSVKYRASEVQALTKKINDSENYDVVFLGANFNNIGEVALSSYGVKDNSRFMATSIAGFGSALNSTATATMDFMNTGIKKTSFYSSNDKMNAISNNNITSSTTN